MSTVPTDSVLRRHYGQMRQAGLLTPTDSVLRRHYEQMQRAARSSAGPGPAFAPAAARREPQAAGRSAATPEPAASRPPPVAQEPAADRPDGGFFGWLKRLFGG